LVTIIGTADGTGTGLDADLLDGSHATAFATAAHTHGASTLTDNAVTNAKLADMVQNRIKGRVTASTGDPEDLTVAQLVTLLNAGSALNADTLDGSHAAAFAAAVHTHGTTGITDNAITNAKLADAAVDTAELVDGAVSTAKLALNAVANTNLADMAMATIKGRAAGAGTGDPTDLSAAQVKALLGIEPTAWTTMTLGSGWSQAETAVKYRKTNDIVEVRGTALTSSADLPTVGTLPGSHWPPQQIIVPIFKRDVSTPANSEMAIATILTNGDIYIRNADYTLDVGKSYCLDNIRFSTSP
jgi:hypothetical protein